ncbi:Periplasmic [Fe] hydrogenase small subunit precursor [Pseudodesulfovibrio hydrargyri]|uniref:Periplasmic [Fe] hydrogenase small subunit n=1 Tax=Pseudodesulfovibrio hydrargyri TaxID=2125990 RepID=A0A1J5MWL5_9BACT|nr:iron hydrogenase small subunit [Pseudodesulfovibrio hydrargyri]OIQ50918.1 Periplasmic [Fe] hydrogenase small subunit precursor [Pseudodesulfovibrio hydrargyri]
MKLNRRGFIKACGFMAGYTVLGLNMTKVAVAATMDFVGLRQKSVYDADAKIYKIRKSQDNPMIKKLYNREDGFLHEGPCGHMSHHLLHTHYVDRSSRVTALKEKGYKFNF